MPNGAKSRRAQNSEERKIPKIGTPTDAERRLTGTPRCQTAVPPAVVVCSRSVFGDFALFEIPRRWDSTGERRAVRRA